MYVCIYIYMLNLIMMGFLAATARLGLDARDAAASSSCTRQQIDQISEPITKTCHQ